ncbi:hypothetical protein SLEP1_g49733 [Rubroshorea leprosula]|uniref:Uncharacterized protein n=1 Tax=Rubroshorea leprosula TaxID=152421 RepID=A0AAV5M0U1_9ROSI|nr:hypothetical protein SLEP1_g49733 [Rubroshorea leprosula]
MAKSPRAIALPFSTSCSKGFGLGSPSLDDGTCRCFTRAKTEVTFNRYACSAIGLTPREEGGIEGINLSSYLAEESVRGVVGRRKGNLWLLFNFFILFSLLSFPLKEVLSWRLYSSIDRQVQLFGGSRIKFSRPRVVDADTMEDDAGGRAFVKFFTAEILDVFEGEWQWRRRGIVNPQY